MSLYFGPANATALGQPQPRTRRGLQQVRAAADLSARGVTTRMQWLHEIAAAVPPAQMIFGVGLQEGPGSSNASCAGAGAPSTATACVEEESLLVQCCVYVIRPQGGCADERNPDCDCYDYGWTQDDLLWMLQQMAAVGVSRLRIWRQDLTPPPETYADPPQWFLQAAAMWINGSIGS
jgi:hypothetical protein